MTIWHLLFTLLFSTSLYWTKFSLFLGYELNWPFDSEARFFFFWPKSREWETGGCSALSGTPISCSVPHKFPNHFRRWRRKSFSGGVWRQGNSFLWTHQDSSTCKSQFLGQHTEVWDKPKGDPILAWRKKLDTKSHPRSCWQLIDSEIGRKLSLRV